MKFICHAVSEIPENELIMPLPIHNTLHLDCKQGAVRAVRFNVDGNYSLTCGSDKTLKLWNPFTGTLLQSYSGHGYEVLDAQGSCDNAQIASGGMDKLIFLWDVAKSVAVRKFRGHAGQVNAVKFNEESSVILSASLDCTVRAWDCRSHSRDPIQIMDEAKDNVTSLHVSDHEILTGSLDQHVRRYDLRKGEMYSDHLGKSVTCVNFTKDGQCILVSCLDNTLKLLDKETGEMLAEYTGHKNEEYRIDSCLNENDDHLFSGSEDGIIYCWDLVESNIKAKLSHVGKVVHSVSSHPSKPCLISATKNLVYVWEDTPREEEKDDS
ncbi:WD repeat domain-containing protein 83-like [Centruroides sculpturatus]|uniref:WD repeat domain-containing protein 83-like n=1 Tax=Centruroides sculpturatus TaxID=218467 RepID=UPI000C6D7B24|nr:WD repeat domain-containing protein 83-like [Centruroides sculpturatus]XP_023230265.1 WD repeat domain-containing protein 83-like [Centruroides sculpturatus]